MGAVVVRLAWLWRTAGDNGGVSSRLTSAAVKARALELGFDLCGVAPVDSFPELRFFEEWLARGYAGEMHYLARSADRRADVRAVLPTARAVIVTATAYNTDRPYSIAHDDPARARLARYAWGEDYHTVILDRLNALLDWMRAESDDPFDARPYVDTGPVQERVYAQYAGIGWIGKNTCVISGKRGSWVFLSEILCSLPLEPDRAATDHCGTCTRCLDACPTGAITEPWVLDATRCLSYLTIELKTAIPEPLREAVGAQVYGCDICQDVCPWNRAPIISTQPAWQPRSAFDGPTLLELWMRSDDELRAIMKGSPMKRAGVKRFRRNLAVALANSGDPFALAALAAPREGDAWASLRDPLVAEHVAWARTRLAPSMSETDETDAAGPTPG
jgi:epoxyqueuosine reductase